jgi:hypothetical protein
MCRPLVVILIFAATVSAFCQTAPSKYQPGTITAVTAHQAASGEQARDVVQYDVSIKVGDTLYTVLYTPTSGSNMVEYSTGLDLLVLVESDTLTINRSGSGTTSALPILRREAVPVQSGLDWSKGPSQYFSLKLDHLSKALNLSNDQQAKIKPFLEQEAGELRTLWNNPTVSRKDKLNTLEKIVRSSDKKIKPLLSQDQVQKLEELRKEQKVELKKRIAEETASKN